MTKDLDIETVLLRLLRERTNVELALGFARYEALRKLNARQYAGLLKRNLEGENFDAMVDALIGKMNSQINRKISPANHEV